MNLKALTTLVCVVPLALGARAVAAQFGGTGSSTSSKQTAGTGTSVSQAQQAIDKAASDSNIVLSEAAKRALAVEAVRQGTVDTDALLGAMKGAGQTSQMNAVETEKLITQAKVEEITPTLSTTIKGRATAATVDVDTATMNSLTADLARQTEALAKSGLSVDDIRRFNESYVDAIYAASRQKRIDNDVYTTARDEVFGRLVRLTIVSVPDKAKVQVAATPIGTTAIQKKPFEPGKPYQFVFSLPGFKTTTREYYVSPAPVEQTIHEVLEPETKK